MFRRFPTRGFRTRSPRAYRPISRASANRAFSRKKTQWVTLYNKVCPPIDTFESDPCTDDEPSGSFTLPLLKPTGAVAGGYDYSQLGDAIRLVRLQGQLCIGVIPSDTSTFGGLGTFRMGLKKVEYSNADANFPTYNPLIGDPDTDGDYSEARWLWLKQKLLGESGSKTLLPPPVVWQPILHDCAADEEICVSSQSLTDGSGRTWDTGIYPTSTGVHTLRLAGECHTCDESGVQQSVTNYGAFPIWRMNVGIKKPLRFADNQMLTLTLAFQDASFPTGQTCTVFFYGGIRALIEI